MGKLIVVDGMKLTLSGQNPPTVTTSITGTTVKAATKTQGGGKKVLISHIEVTVQFSGHYDAAKTLVFQGTASGNITAKTPRVTCEGQAILLDGDSTTIPCTGSITAPNGATSSGPASVTVTITNANQTTIFAPNT
jgi:hypothetical protein